MPPGNQACSLTNRAVLSFRYSVAMSGLMPASTKPLAIPMTTVAANSMVKSVANTVSKTPAICPTAASFSSRPIPSRSHSVPPNRIDSPKPQNAAPLIQPNWILSSPNSSSNSPMMSPRMAKDIAVASRAMQLATNRRCGFMSFLADGDEWCHPREGGNDEQKQGIPISWRHRPRDVADPDVAKRHRIAVILQLQRQLCGVLLVFGLALVGRRSAQGH